MLKRSHELLLVFFVPFRTNPQRIRKIGLSSCQVDLQRSFCSTSAISANCRASCICRLDESHTDTLNISQLRIWTCRSGLGFLWYRHRQSLASLQVKCPARIGMDEHGIVPGLKGSAIGPSSQNGVLFTGAQNSRVAALKRSHELLLVLFVPFRTNPQRIRKIGLSSCQVDLKRSFCSTSGNFWRDLPSSQAPAGRRNRCGHAFSSWCMCQSSQLNCANRAEPTHDQNKFPDSRLKGASNSGGAPPTAFRDHLLMPCSTCRRWPRRPSILPSFLHLSSGRKPHRHSQHLSTPNMDMPKWAWLSVISASTKPVELASQVLSPYWNGRT